MSKRKQRAAVAPWVRWVARGTGTIVVAFWLFVSVMGTVVEGEAWTTESLILAGLIALSVVGMALAWWHEGIGGGVVTVCGIAHSAFAVVVAGHNKVLAVLVAGAPLTVIGALFLLIWWRARR